MVRYEREVDVKSKKGWQWFSIFWKNHSDSYDGSVTLMYFFGLNEIISWEC